MAQTPTPDYVAQVSEDQAMITDEWAPTPPPDEDRPDQPTPKA